MLILRGSPALSPFRLQKLLDALVAAGLPVRAVAAEFVHLAERAAALRYYLDTETAKQDSLKTVAKCQADAEKEGATTTTDCLETDFDALTSRLNATMIDGQVDHPVLLRKASLAVADDVSVRSIAWTPQDDAEVRVLRVNATHTAGGITVTATLSVDNGADEFLMDTSPTVSVASVNGTSKASLDLRTVTGTRQMLFKGVRYRLTLSVVGGTLTQGQAVLLLRTRRRAR